MTLILHDERRALASGFRNANNFKQLFRTRKSFFMNHWLLRLYVLLWLAEQPRSLVHEE